MYNAIVVGGGHAGCEASLALARLNKKTLLITGNKEYIASMPCNPSVGGPAKGILVREIDALGGEMGINTDKTYIQMRLLNSSAGPAVQALRAQSDKYKYHEEMLKTLENTENLTLIEGYVKSLVTEGNAVKGVTLEDGRTFAAETVILTTGTYLNSVCFRGEEKTFSGPENQKTYSSLSNNLKELGFNIIRLKTGTPPRVLDSSIDYSLMNRQDGDIDSEGFSYRTKQFLSLDKQVPCYLIHTTKETHKIIFDNLEKSALYGGEITGIGPRYCPSIETKLVRFKDKESHQVFVEPVSLSSHKMYLQGFSTSMPEDIQERMVKSLPGFKNAEIIEYAYAIEYDALDPLDMKVSLESKIIKGLFTAGQINGTSGYEEAAAQGIMAGINASLLIDKKDPLILRRDEAYIGVLIDDLVTKGVEDPYRMLTSRAEYRLLLRHDNADTRLSAYGHAVGLLSDEAYNEFLTKEEAIKKEKEFLKETFITGKKEINEKALKMGVSLIKDKTSLYDLIKRPDYDFKKTLEVASLSSSLDSNTIRQIEIDIKYEGYIKKAEKQAEDAIKVEKIKIPEDIDYNKINNIASEAKEKLNKIRPLNVSQASRISGVNPADISILLVYLKSKGKRQ